jgi:hypothetical protein
VKARWHYGWWRVSEAGCTSYTGRAMGSCCMVVALVLGGSDVVVGLGGGGVIAWSEGIPMGAVDCLGVF